MVKKALAALLAILTIITTTLAVQAAETTGNATGAGKDIMFNAAGWKNFNTVYCHIWVIGGSSFYGWQAQAEKCEKVSGTTYKYDTSVLNSSDYISGGFKSGEKYGIIFSADTGVQTYDATFGVECLGDTAYLTGNKVENPVDSKKSSDECVWTKNHEKYGPHLAITSTGNIIGEKLVANESHIQIIGDWILNYYLSPKINSVDILSKVYPAFNIKTLKDVQSIYSYIQSKDSGEDESQILRQLNDAYYKAYPKQGNNNPSDDTTVDYYDINKWDVYGIKNKTYTGNPITQEIIVTNGKEIATVDTSYSKNKNAGTAILVISGKGKYTGISIKTFRILKAKNPIKITYKKTATVSSKRTTTIKKFIKANNAKGAVSYKTNNKKCTIKNGNLIVAKGLKKGKTYKLKVSITAKGNSNYNKKSISSTIKIKVK